MPLSRLENFLRNAEGNILYVSPSDFDSTDSFENRGNSLTRPFKTIQRALIEAARFSYQNGRNNDKIDRTTILVYPGTHYIDNRPGFSVTASGSTAVYKKKINHQTWVEVPFPEFGSNSNYDILDTNNDLYKFNSINGGVILPRGTSIIGYDLRKTKIRPLYVPNPESGDVESSSIFNVTGTCYFSTFTFLDADTTKTVFRDYTDNRFVPNFSHHKLFSFTYADGVNKVALGSDQTDLTDLDMYYYKVAKAYGDITGRGILDYPENDDFEPFIDEFRIVGALQSNPIGISSIFGGDGITKPKNLITVTTKNFLTGDDEPHGLSVNSPILISGVTADSLAFNGSFTVKEVVGLTTFTYTSTASPSIASPTTDKFESATVTIESDSVSSASPYILNCSLRSAYGLCGLWADGAKSDGFKSVVVAQFTGVSLQKDDNAFLIYKDGNYLSNLTLDQNSTERPLHTNGNAIYKPDYENTHIRVSNNAFVQCVSIFAIGFSKHFLTESGGDMSITNSNSNFGATSLESIGFRNESFDRDDVGYITHIIPPRELDKIDTKINWMSLDVEKIISVGVTSKLYLFGEKNIDSKPTHQVDGYRIGARKNDSLYLPVVVGTSKTTYSTPILMTVPHGSGVSHKKEYVVTRTGSKNEIENDIFTLNSNHQLFNGEKIRLFSDTGQSPDRIDIDTIYYAITDGLNQNQIKLAFTLNDAIEGKEISGIGNNGGVLTIVSTAGDKLPNEFGHPIQYDSTQKQWYINGGQTTSTNKIYEAIVQFGVQGITEETPLTYVNRISDIRSIEDRIYKFRYVIPKEFTNARPPQPGFVLQESKTVGVSAISFNNEEITSETPPTYLRNEKIISNVTSGAISNGRQSVTVTTEIPHGFVVGDRIKIQKVRSSNNVLGTGITSTYNGSYEILSTPNTKQFTYQITGVKLNPGTFSNSINERDTNQERAQLPLVSREEYVENYFIYRVNTIRNHIPGIDGQDGIYQLIVLSSNVRPSANVGYGLSNKEFNQDVKNLYPQIDRDNFNSDPNGAVSYADLKIIGKVITNDKKKSITKETVNNFIKNTRIGFAVTGITLSGSGNTTITVHTDVEHSLNSIGGLSLVYNPESNVSGAGYGNTTIYASPLSGGSGTNGSVRANLVSGSVQTIKIVDPGCFYQVGDVLTISPPPGITPSINATATVTSINNNIGDAIELSGFDQEELNGVYRIIDVPSTKSLNLYKPFGLTSYTSNTNKRMPVATLASKGIGITSVWFDDISTGIVTVTTASAHGLFPGNKFTIVGSGHTIYDNSFIVKDNVGVNTFTFNVGVVTQTKSSTTGTLLKHAFGSNAFTLSRGEDNLTSRASYFYAGITTTLTTELTKSSSIIGLSSTSGFNRGDYVLINGEIIRLSFEQSGNNFKILRGKFSTNKTTAEVGSQVKKIKVLPMEVRRPSFMRASGHTFEYIGYGPGNYSTGMPQKQNRTLSEDEILVSQAKEQGGGTVVYTGMNDLGEFYSGSKKLSSATGEEKIVDAPVITFTGDDSEGENQNKLSGIFDDALVRDRIVVEGGDSGNQSSQFYGPVNFNKKVISTSDEGISVKNLFIGGDSSNKLITVGVSTPTSSNFLIGDISLKSNPSDGYLGQVYINNDWKRFGLISNSPDILDIKIDKLGIGNSSSFDTVNDVKLYVDGKAKVTDLVVTNSVSFNNNVTLNQVNFNDIDIRKTARFTGIGGTDYAIYVNSPGISSPTALKTRLYDLETQNNAYILGNVGIGTTSKDERLQINGNIYLQSIGSHIKKRFENDIEEYLVRGETLSEYNPWITYTRSETEFNRGFTFGTNDGAGNKINWLSLRDGKLGINTTTQSSTLTVIGDAYIRDSVGVGITNPSSKFVVNGTFGLNEISSTDSSGRTLFSTSSNGFVLNHNNSSQISIKILDDDKLTIGVAGLTTIFGRSKGTETKGSHLKISNIDTGDTILSWENIYNNANRRWYAGIDVSDGYSWKLASPITSNFENEDFNRGASGGNPKETKLKIDVNGNAEFTGGITIGSGITAFGGITVNTDKFTVNGTTGDTVISGTLNSGAITSSGKIETTSNLVINGAATFGSTVNINTQITSPSFKVTGATDDTLLLRANGTSKSLSKAELDAAAGFSIQAPVTNSTLPNGNSEQLLPITFDGISRTYQLKRSDNTLFTPISAANLLVSVGGVIQRADTDYTTSGSTITFPESSWGTPPPSGLNCFIIAFGGLGGLRQNNDWDIGDKGVLLVGSGTDNLGIKLGAGTNNSILTVDVNTESGVAWKNSINVTGSIAGSTFIGNGIIPVGGVIMWSGDESSIGTGSLSNWRLCNGSNGTPDLRDKFIVGTVFIMRIA